MGVCCEKVTNKYQIHQQARYYLDEIQYEVSSKMKNNHKFKKGQAGTNQFKDIEHQSLPKGNIYDHYCKKNRNPLNKIAQNKANFTKFINCTTQINSFQKKTEQIPLKIKQNMRKASLNENESSQQIIQIELQSKQDENPQFRKNSIKSYSNSTYSFNGSNNQRPGEISRINIRLTSTIKQLKP